MSAVAEAPGVTGEGLYRPTWAEIDLSALAWNLRQIRSRIPAGTEVVAVLKADAYGHGAALAGRALSGEGVKWFGVSTVEEGLALRSAGFGQRLLVLGTSFPFESFEPALRAGLTPTVGSPEGLRALREAAGRLGKTGVPFHLKVDTGMGRIGVSPAGAGPLFESLRRDPVLHLEGLYTHFSSADTDPARTRAQWEVLQEAAGQARGAGLDRFSVHAANSAAIFSLPETHGDMVRPGLALYGLSPWDSPPADPPELRPVLSWKTRIVFVKSVPAGTPVSYAGGFRTSRPSRIATLPVGYADGYRRDLSNAGRVLVRGRWAPVAGRVTMDHVMIDVTDLEPAPEAGEEVVLLGRQGDREITAWELARISRTIPYEILCGISKRVPRVFREGR